MVSSTLIHTTLRKHITDSEWITTNLTSKPAGKTERISESEIVGSLSEA